ncbi:hypothetical protein [Kocuria kalidii]|uniref:hypothetical protein n=1 Tax=Kocuria kalidii TaxID=3376283 RepID=UPI00378DC901
MAPLIVVGSAPLVGGQLTFTTWEFTNSALVPLRDELLVDITALHVAVVRVGSGA